MEGAVFAQIRTPSWSYQLTQEDVLWAARMAAFEGGEPADVLWTVTQRLAMFHARKKPLSFAALAQDFSQPINPRWAEGGEFCGSGGKYAGTDYCTQLKLRRRERARSISLLEIATEFPEVAKTVDAWAHAALPNPVEGATNFSAPSVAQSFISRTPGAAVLYKRGNWFIRDAGVDWPADYVTMYGPDGRVASSQGAPGNGALAFVFGAMRTAANWWRV